MWCAFDAEFTLEPLHSARAACRGHLGLSHMEHRTESEVLQNQREGSDAAG